MNMSEEKPLFSGNIFAFSCFDIGEDINLEKIKQQGSLVRKPISLSKYFKNYHIPLAVELPNAETSTNCVSAKLHNFGVLSLTYKIPLTLQKLETIRVDINSLENQYREQSIIDAGSIFKLIKNDVKQPNFFHLQRSYMLIQVNPIETIDSVSLKDTYGNMIASLLRFETEALSEYQKNEILETAVGYYRGDLIIIDTEAAFVYDDEYEEFLDLFEFANVQQLELQFFDRLLDQQLNTVYERQIKTRSLKSYLPFVTTAKTDPVGDLGRLRVDISVITERLESSIKLAGEPYYAELYSLLVEKLDLTNWKESINRKLEIIRDVRTVYENKIETIREDMLTVLIIILIFIEMIVGILHYLK
jgi:hypothetical protein